MANVRSSRLDHDPMSLNRLMISSFCLSVIRKTGFRSSESGSCMVVQKFSLLWLARPTKRASDSKGHQNPMIPVCFWHEDSLGGLATTVTRISVPHAPKQGSRVLDVCQR